MEANNKVGKEQTKTNSLSHWSNCSSSILKTLFDFNQSLAVNKCLKFKAYSSNSLTNDALGAHWPILNWMDLVKLRIYAKICNWNAMKCNYHFLFFSRHTIVFKLVLSFVSWPTAFYSILNQCSLYIMRVRIPNTKADAHANSLPDRWLTTCNSFHISAKFFIFKTIPTTKRLGHIVIK